MASTLDATSRPRDADDDGGPPSAGAAARTRVSAVVAGGDALSREGMMSLLRQMSLDVVTVAPRLADLSRKLRAHRPDIAIVDVDCPASSAGGRASGGIEALEELDWLPVLFVSCGTEHAQALLSTRDRRVGYLLKQHIDDAQQLADVACRVAGGHVVVDSEVLCVLAGRALRSDPLSELTRGERCVLELIADGGSNRGIAEELVVTVPAVERHVTAIFAKLGLAPDPAVSRRVLAALRYRECDAGTDPGRRRRPAPGR